MSRKPNTLSTGMPFDNSIIDAVWKKAKTSEGSDHNMYRRDICGAWIKRSEFGKTTEFGWEIDHIKPVSKAGTDDLANLQPLHWENNRCKGEDWPEWNCALSDIQ